MRIALALVLAVALSGCSAASQAPAASPSVAVAAVAAAADGFAEVGVQAHATLAAHRVGGVLTEADCLALWQSLRARPGWDSVLPVAPAPVFSRHCQFG